ncbi:lysozyme inhibitor LprI family protein [Xanthobacter sp. AM11]|uniref:lysozyme inhibitor LprI family protein n=1 Tax=Xanthobacter sp. AM11 TaxID=3380643 RepID=UPI0039BEE058
MAGAGGGVWRRRAPAVLLLAVALAPALLLYVTRPAPPPPAGVAPEMIGAAPSEEAPADTGTPDAALPDPARTDTAPPPAASGPAAKVATTVATTAAAKTAPTAPERWQRSSPCPRERLSGRQYNRCLYDNTRTSEQALEAEVANAIAVIEARTDLPGVQRAKWKSLLDEAQSRFLLFRTFDCQSVAPFEGPRGIGNFEQRALCLIEANTRRATDLRARYGSPMPLPEGPQGPQDRGGTWTHAVPPPLD